MGHGWFQSKDDSVGRCGWVYFSFFFGWWGGMEGDLRGCRAGVLGMGLRGSSGVVGFDVV